jgi:hypothetical protein
MSSQGTSLGISAQGAPASMRFAPTDACRQEIVQHTGTAEGDDVWTRLGRYWKWLGEELDPTGTGSTKRISEDRAIDLALMLAKLERNLIAGLSIHQEKAL